MGYRNCKSQQTEFHAAHNNKMGKDILIKKQPALFRIKPLPIAIDPGFLLSGK